MPGRFALAVTCIHLLASGVQVAFGQPALFAEEEALAVEIAGPLSTLLRERSDTDYYEGTLRVASPGAEARELSLKFRARGNFRRRRDTCRFPPVRLNFKRDEVADTVFAGQNILKLVTHCRPDSDSYEQYALKEHLAYKIFELHSPYAFRTRLLRITWVDTDDDDREDVRYGFVIEHKDHLAERLAAEHYEPHQSSYTRLDRHAAATVAMFQYLIGNTDFSMVAGPEDDSCCHNGILLETGEANRQLPIPYDFDLSGFVNAPYATPDPRFRIKRVTRRLYRGHCSLNEEVTGVAAHFAQQEGAVMALLQQQPGLSDRSRRRAASFLEGFYSDIKDPRRLESRLLKRCS